MSVIEKESQNTPMVLKVVCAVLVMFTWRTAEKSEHEFCYSTSKTVSQGCAHVC